MRSGRKLTSQRVTAGRGWEGVREGGEWREGREGVRALPSVKAVDCRATAMCNSNLQHQWATATATATAT